MNEKTKQVLEATIDRFDSIVRCDGRDDKDGITDWPLCDMFMEEGCLGCPVYEKTHQQECLGTPYHGWYVAESDTERKKFAEMQRDFLESLSPIGGIK